MSTIEVRVAGKHNEADGICSYELVRVDGAVHDVFLSREAVRQRAYDEVTRWSEAYLPSGPVTVETAPVTAETAPVTAETAPVTAETAPVTARLPS